MKFIKSRRSWAIYKNKEFRDTQEEPEQYPCYVYERVLSWGYEESEPMFLYRKDLVDMLLKLDGSEN